MELKLWEVLGLRDILGQIKARISWLGWGLATILQAVGGEYLVQGTEVKSRMGSPATLLTKVRVETWKARELGPEPTHRALILKGFKQKNDMIL